MNGNNMGDEVVAALQLINPGMTPAQVTQLTTAWRAICGAVVLHVQTNAVVSTNDTGTAAVSTAPGTAPVTATGTGTVA